MIDIDDANLLFATYGTPDSMKYVVNASEMIGFVHRAQARDQFTDLTHHIATVLSTMVTTEELRDRLLVSSGLDEVHAARVERAQKWIDEVMKPALMKRPQILCVEVDYMIVINNKAVTDSYPDGKAHSSQKIAVCLQLPEHEVRLDSMKTRCMFGGFTTKISLNGPVRWLSKYDAERYTNAVAQRQDPSQKSYFFVKEWADFWIGSLRDWLLGGGASIPKVLTKMSPEQAFDSAMKWHEQLQRRKAREAEKKLATMDKGGRDPIGSITLGLPARGTDGKKICLTISHLLDKQSLEYESVLQHNCVDSFWYRTYTGESVILHVDDTNGGRWTAEISGDSITTPLGSSRHLTFIRQFKGPTNIEAPRELRTALQFWLYHMNLFIYCDRFEHDRKLHRYPFIDNSPGSSSLYATGLLGKMLQENSKSRFDGKSYVIELECSVPERSPFSGRGSPDPTTKYRVVPSGQQDDLIADGQFTFTSFTLDTNLEQPK